MAHPHTLAGRVHAIGIAGLLFITSGGVHAGGFALVEQSVSSMGNAYAGAGSIAQDASTVFFNPASMSRLEGRQISGGLHIVFPETEFNGVATYNASHPAIIGVGLDGPPPPGNGDILAGADNDTDAATIGALPHFTYVQELNDRLNFGFSVNVPFGLKTEYGSGWVGRYSAVEGEIKTVNLNPTLSFKIDEHASIGVGVSAMYANLIYQTAVDGGLNALLQGSPIPLWVEGSEDNDILVKYDVDDWGFGWNMGLLLEPTDHTRFGLAYRSKVEVELEGDFTSSNPAVLGPTNALADVSLPDTLRLSAYHEVNPQWAVMADILWTGWSHLDALSLRTPNQSPVGFSNTIPLKWEDAFRYSVGASYKHDDRWTLRGGLMFDETPIPSPEFRLAALPDEDRIWLTLGTGYKFSRQLSFDVGYAHLFIDDPRINSTDSYSSLAAPLVEGLHRITGDYDAAVDIISAQVNWKF